MHGSFAHCSWVTTCSGSPTPFQTSETSAHIHRPVPCPKDKATAPQRLNIFGHPDYGVRKSPWEILRDRPCQMDRCFSPDLQPGRSLAMGIRPPTRVERRTPRGLLSSRMASSTSWTLKVMPGSGEERDVPPRIGTRLRCSKGKPRGNQPISGSPTCEPAMKRRYLRRVDGPS